MQAAKRLLHVMLFFLLAACLWAAEGDPEAPVAAVRGGYIIKPRSPLVERVRQQERLLGSPPVEYIIQKPSGAQRRQAPRHRMRSRSDLSVEEMPRFRIVRGRQGAQTDLVPRRYGRYM